MAEKKSIEENLTALEDTINELSKEDVSLEKAFSLYESGMKLVKEVESEIDTVEKKVLEISGGVTREFQ